MEEELVRLVTETKMPFRRIAWTLSRQFGIPLFERTCYDRAYKLGLKGGLRETGPREIAPLVEAA